MAATNDQATRFTLSRIEDRISWLSQELAKAEGYRDSLLAELCDSEGLDDKRVVGVR